MKKRLQKKLTKKLLVSPMTDNLEWAVVLRSEPEKAAQCPVLKQFDGIAWWWILIRQPQLDYLCNWRNFKGMISTKWFSECKHDFQWFVSALLHLTELTSMYKNKEVTYE